MKSVIRTDIFCLLFFLLSLFSGVAVFCADCFFSHDVWHNWSVVHVVANIGFLVSAIIHIKQHWAWFKRIVLLFEKRSKVTFVLSLMFVAVVLSGFYLLPFADGQGTVAGLVHFVLGLLFSLFALWHISKRWSVFLKGLK